LRYLDLIDEDGKPTDNSRLLKTKGATYTLALQEIVRKAYAGVFRGHKPNEITREGVYNYFVTEGGLGAEMATKATRFLVKLCRMAEIELAPELSRGASRGKRRQKLSHSTISSPRPSWGAGTSTSSPLPWYLPNSPWCWR
jgi:hypothetical protein